MAGPVRVGTSGWIYKHWRGIVYPKALPTARWFAAYAARFDTVEINNTFYRLPAAETFVGWRAQAPARFLYAVKASRYLTHMKKLKDPADPLALFLGRARELGDHLGPILYQLPPHWGCDPDRLRTFVAALPPGLRHVIEFRDPSWYTDEVRAILTAGGLSFCVHDMRGSESPWWVTGPLVYLRFHGSHGAKYTGEYGRDALRPWADRAREYHRQGKEVVAYFNTDIGGHAVTDAEAFRALVAG